MTIYEFYAKTNLIDIIFRFRASKRLLILRELILITYSYLYFLVQLLYIQCRYCGLIALVFYDVEDL